MDKNLTVEKALKELLAEKKFLLNDSKALVTILHKHVAPVHAMQLTLFRKALLDANIGEVLMVADGLDKNARSTAEAEAVARLKKINLPEESAMLVIQTLTETMGWNKKVLEPPELSSISVNEMKFFPIINNNVQSSQQETTKSTLEPDELIGEYPPLDLLVTQQETLKSNPKTVATHINTIAEDDKIDSKTSSDTRNNSVSVVEIFQQARNRKTAKAINKNGKINSKTSNDVKNNNISVTEIFQWARRSFKIQEIIVAFNEMMRETAKATGFGSNMQIRQKFMKDYNVIAFKCVNFIERVNHPEEKPRFVVCETSESTLWGVPLLDGTLAVLPSLREYESTAHYQGGLKELFGSNYISGSYQKIEVIRPAIMNRDYQITQKGELNLSR